MGVKRAVNPAVLDVVIGLGQTSVDDPALRRCVFIVCVLELRALDHQLGGDDDLAALKREFHEVALREAGLVTEAGRDGHLALVLNFGGGVHKKLKGSFRKSGIPTSKCRIATGTYTVKFFDSTHSTQLNARRTALRTPARFCRILLFVCGVFVGESLH